MSRLSHLRAAVALLAMCVAAPVVAGDLADPAFLEQYAATYRFRHGHPTAFSLTPDGRTVLFLRSGPRSFVRDLYAFDTGTGEERVLLRAEDVLRGAEEQLTAEEKARRERMRLAARGIATYELSQDGKRILVPLSGRLFVVDLAQGWTKELESEAGYPIDPRLSPDGARVACVREGDLYVTDVASGRERRLTTGASETVSHGLAEFVAQEEMGRYHGYWWAPDGRTIAYQETDTSKVERLYIGDPFEPERQAQPWPYPRPGRANASVRVGLVGVDGGETRWVAWDQARYPYLATVRWQAGAPLTLVVQNREQTEEAVLAVDARKGTTRALHVERDGAWLNLDQDLPRWLPGGERFLWATERDGGWALELRDRKGKFVRRVLAPSAGYAGLLHVDAERGLVYVRASSDPTVTHVYAASLDGDEAPRRITEAAGVHSAAFSDDGSVFVETARLFEGGVRHVVRAADGRELGALRVVAEQAPFQPNVELVKVGGGEGFHTAVVRPRDFEKGQRYPVLVYVYGGPGVNMVVADRSRYLLHQWMADHGFVVVIVDGRGTPRRGREWERAIKGDLVTAPMDDQAAAITALGARFPEMDLERVGVYGWSYGGYMAAMAVMVRPDVFKAAVAVAPVVDWRDYDTHYTERYLGLPDKNPQGYEVSSVLTWADKLARPLRILHGTADDNVYFFHSLKLSHALFRAGKEHELVPLVGFTHSVPDPLMTVRIYDSVVGHFRRCLR